MPDLDSGHIFLTTLAPIKVGKADGTNTSFEQQVRTALAELPTALQSPATQKIGLNSPFSRNKRTHLARMFVLSNVIYTQSTLCSGPVPAETKANLDRRWLQGTDPVFAPRKSMKSSRAHGRTGAGRPDSRAV